mmetsp:Transcript_21160/g.49623  ORF Transcript_21160/g.49623 Transcript_21160/m.49623 type:complete len:357 (+) Transcript_21160:1002-2072(+)
MHQLPTSLLVLLGRLQIKLLFVPPEVVLKGADHDDGHQTGQEEDNHKGVEDREPVNLLVLHLQVCVPARRPLDWARLPENIIGPDDLGRRLFVSIQQQLRIFEASIDGVFLRAGLKGALPVLACLDTIALLVFKFLFLHGPVEDAEGLNFKTNDAIALEGRILVVQNCESKMVVEIYRGVFGLLLVALRCNQVTKLVTNFINLGSLFTILVLKIMSHCQGQIVQEHVHTVIILRHRGKFFNLIRCVSRCAENLAVLILQNLERVRSGMDSASMHDFSEVENLVRTLLFRRLTKWKSVILVWQLCPHGIQFLGLDDHFISLLIVLWCYSGQVECMRQNAAAQQQGCGQHDAWGAQHP